MERSSSEMKSASFTKFSPRDLPQSFDGGRGHDHHSIAINLTRNSNLITPKKWTEAQWREGTQSAVRPRVTLANLSASEWNTRWAWGLRYQVTGLRQDSGAGQLAAARHPNAYVRHELRAKDKTL
jgi:hypothetical protein